MANVANKKKVNVNEYRDKIFFDTIDYAHNAKKGETVYHPGFSPNNIKRLIICPDRTVVYYYVTRKADKNIPLDYDSKQTAYPASRLFQYAQQEDYEPLISAISFRLVATSIQEIIFCMKACDLPIELTQKEFDFNCLIKSYNNKKAGLMETIKSRYKRLGYISIFNGNYNQLKGLIGQKKHKSFFIDNPDIKNACVKVMPINNETWFDNWGQNAATKDGLSGYMLDNNGSALNLYFKRIQEKKANEKAKEEDGFEQFKAEKKKVSDKTKDTFNKTLETYKKFVNCGFTLLNKLQSSSNSIYQDYDVNAKFKNIATVLLISTSIYGEKDADKKYGISVQKPTDNIGSAEDSAKNNIEVLKRKCHEIYEVLIELLAQNIIGNSEYRDMYIVALHDFDNVLKSTENPIINSLTAYLDKDLFKGTKLKDAMANVCYLISLLYLSKRSDKDIYECLNKDYWFEKL